MHRNRHGIRQNTGDRQDFIKANASMDSSVEKELNKTCQQFFKKITENEQENDIKKSRKGIKENKNQNSTNKVL
ncbi:MAG: hypothetical protein LBQ28_03570 [Prevotellaceae bacterium]|nr:hypothetical protein [Prevotellaceae bacterium]